MRTPPGALTVYPRVCGGTPTGAAGGTPAVGLSPRVRGNHQRRAQVGGVVGSIPACAGEPTPASAATMTPAVYPRVCGGTPATPMATRPASGLSPRVRGNRQAGAGPDDSARSIPACAGEPLGLMAVSLALWGLSPRVRGNLTQALLDGVGRGSIPACAGEPEPPRGPGKRPKVYPRVCGGTPLRSTTAASQPGLSPRVRGNLARGQRGQCGLRSIPACAGEPGWSVTRMV